MGQAKQRGTFEQRKAKAIASGNVKGERFTKSLQEEIKKEILNDYPSFSVIAHILSKRIKLGVNRS